MNAYPIEPGIYWCKPSRLDSEWKHIGIIHGISGFHKLTIICIVPYCGWNLGDVATSSDPLLWTWGPRIEPPEVT